MEIDKILVQEFRSEVMQAVTAIASRYGLNTKQQNHITYSPTNFNIKYTFSDNNVDIEKVKWNNNCIKYGLQSKHYGLVFKSDENTFKLTGINTRAKTYPINFLFNGESRKAGAGYIKALLIKEGVL